MSPRQATTDAYSWPCDTKYNAVPTQNKKLTQLWLNRSHSTSYNIIMMLYDEVALSIITVLLIEFNSGNNCSYDVRPLELTLYIAYVVFLKYRQWDVYSTVPQMTFTSHSRSSALSSFVRSPKLSIRDLK